MLSKPRERAMPLVPEPFQHLSISRQSVFLGRTPMAATWCRFCPNMNISQYRNTLSETEKTELDKRSFQLSNRAAINRVYESSEFRWEACAWQDVFGPLLDDEALRMDKRPYEFVGEGDDGDGAVKTKIPDATLGLKTYDEWDLENGFVCEATDCHRAHTQPDERLSEDRLDIMMHNAGCGLVVDGVWGKTNLVFPFAVYEAKKRVSSFEEAEGQVYHACKTYLAMLDDLARNPDNVAEYQSEESSRYQMFAYTFCGPIWEVFVAWKMLDTCHIETIWQGNVTDRSRAYDLICLTDQIHKYAVNQHRTFVMEHLEAWYDRQERLLLGALPPLEDLNAAVDEVDESEGGLIRGSDSDDPDRAGSLAEVKSTLALLTCMDAVFSQTEAEPEWLRLKENAKKARARKAQTQKQHNKTLRKLVQTSGHNKVAPGVKRKGGPGSKVTKTAPKRGAKNARGSRTKHAPGSFGMRLRSSRRQT